MVAALLSVICKNPSLSEDDDGVDDEEELELANDEAYLHQMSHEGQFIICKDITLFFHNSTF